MTNEMATEASTSRVRKTMKSSIQSWCYVFPDRRHVILAVSTRSGYVRHRGNMHQHTCSIGLKGNVTCESMHSSNDLHILERALRYPVKAEPQSRDQQKDGDVDK